MQNNDIIQFELYVTNLITEAAVVRMGIKVRKTHSSFVGVNGATLGASIGTVVLRIQLPHSPKSMKALFYVVKIITSYTPSAKIKSNTSCFDHLELADKSTEVRQRLKHC